ncbi:MAG: OmpA family protein [Candidatus Kapabacteria bacterium]|jgi:outer membrane protein OmpA-like peptidoglycan-associated protein|nr:OmpA family protein [Candidatus Kapabacteria bacterium]
MQERLQHWNTEGVSGATSSVGDDTSAKTDSSLPRRLHLLFTTRKQLCMQQLRTMVLCSFAALFGCLSVFSPPHLFAQSSSAPPKAVSFGGFGAININQHTASFNSLPGVPILLFNGVTSARALDLKNQVRFGDATGLGFTVGGLADIPLADALALSLRVSYATHNAQLQATEDLRRVGFLNSRGDSVAFFTGSSRFTLTPNLGSVGIEPLLAWSPISAAPNFRIFVGGRVGFMIQSSFSQTEQLLDPVSGAVWNNNSIERNNIPGSAIPEVSPLNLLLTGGLGYDIPIGKLILSPEAFYSYALTPFVNGLPWTANTIRGGFSLRYSPDPPPVPKEENPPKQDTTSTIAQNTPPEKPQEQPKKEDPPPDPPKDFKKQPVFKHADENPKGSLNASISAFMVDSTGTEVPLVRLKVEQFFAWQMYPLMNYIFFDQNSPELPDRYRLLKSREETQNFSEQDFHNVNMLKVYYDVLNIIGSRMKNLPNAKIQLVGCNNNIGLEAGNIQLSYRRADEIRRYLIDTWGVDSSRIVLQARNLPEKPTKSRDSLGIEENRRVEIYSDVWDVLKPVLVNDTINIPEPPTIRFRMNIKADDGVAKSTLNVKQGERSLKLFSMSGKPDSTLDWNPIIDWNTIADQGSAPSTPDALKFGLDVVDKKGEEAHPNGAIPVELVTVKKKQEAGVMDKQLAIYRLILFDFNSPSVGTNNSRIINSFILDNLKDGSKVDITGFTDKLGNPDVNQKLSSGRAKSVADYLKWRDTQFRGVGGSRPQYTNETPEGRLYNRSVEIRVETPVMMK